MATKIKTVEDALNELDTPTHANLCAALVAAQAELPAPRKDREVEVFSRRTNSKYKFRYATMAGMLETDKPILAKHGLAFTQFVRDGQMVTSIIHEGGEAIECGIPMPELPAAPQEAGSIITYFKRYSYCAAFGRVAEEEDDANIAEGNDYTAGNITPAQRDTLLGLIERAGITAERFCKRFEVDAVAALPSSKFQEARAALENKIKEPANA